MSSEAKPACLRRGNASRANLTVVKTVRIWLLLLLAVLLPLRGAMAAAMLCPVGGTGMQNELRMQDRPVAHEAMDHDEVAYDHAGADHDHDHSGHHQSA